MKSLLLILIYIGTFIGMFLLISLIGLLWIDSYTDVIRDGDWFMMYTLSFGWWLAAFPCREYYMHNLHYFEKHF